MKAEKKPFDAILSELDLSGAQKPPKSTKPVTFWMLEDYKLKYERLQKLSRGQFSKTVKRVLEELIEAAEAKAS